MQLITERSDGNAEKAFDHSGYNPSAACAVCGRCGAVFRHDRAVYEKNHEVLLKNSDWLAATEAGLDSAEDLLAQFYEMVAQHRAMNNRWQKMAIEFVKSHPNSALVPNIIDRLISFGCDEQTIEPLINALTVDQQQGTLGSLMAVRHEISKLNGGKVGSKALDFTLGTIDGGSVTLSECYQKGYVLLDFWASWCVPCIYEIPKLREIHKLYGDKLQILSISADEDIVECRVTQRSFHDPAGSSEDHPTASGEAQRHIK